jgi:DNA invertase Pin-like site-specific DNA recombinase
MTDLIDAAAYYRMSDEKQENSIERQKSRVEPFAPANGYRIVAVYTDRAVAGDEVAKRKDFQRMLRDAQAGKFRAILCDDKDRFSRLDLIDEAEVVAPLRRRGVWLHTVIQGRIDWETFAGRITAAMLAEAKNIEKRAISSRVLSQQLLRAQQGKNNGGPARYGYRWKPHPTRGKVRVPDGRKAEVVRLIFELYDRGHTRVQIAAELFRRGVASPGGNDRWSLVAIYRVLTDTTYLGDAPWGKHPEGKHYRYRGGEIVETARGERRNQTNAPEGLVVAGESHEPLIDRDLFQRVQARLAGRRHEKGAPAGATGDKLLSGLLVCGHCGSFMQGSYSGGRRTYFCGGHNRYTRAYCHKNTAREKPLKDFLVATLEATFLDPENIAALRRDLTEELAAAGGESARKRLAAQIAALDRKVRQATERLALIELENLADYQAQLRAWRAERDGLREELARVESASPVAELEERLARAEALLWKLRKALDGGDDLELRDIFQDMVEKVELFWTHRETPTRTLSKLERGILHLKPEGELEILFQAATGRSCSTSRMTRPSGAR